MDDVLLLPLGPKRTKIVERCSSYGLLLLRMGISCLMQTVSDIRFGSLLLAIGRVAVTSSKKTLVTVRS